MEETKKLESHLTSAAAFVEGGIQVACEDTCSICLEAFCESDPSAVTGCKHEFHLQCILEWCQRSSHCPMCWQPISLKDPSSQELLDAVEHEKSIRMNPSRNTTIFHHPTLGDFELQHLPVGATDSELEERIIQHLAAAAAMGRARHISRREAQRSRSSAHGRQNFLMFSSQSNAHSAAPSSSPTQRGEAEPASAVMVTGPTSLVPTEEESMQLIASPYTAQPDQVSASMSASSVLSAQLGTPNSRRSPSQSSPSNQDRAGPSDLQSFSESLKARLSAASMRYKESIAKSTRGWKDRLFSRSSPVTDISSEVRREVNAGIATVSRMIDRLETRDGSRTSTASVTTSLEHGPSLERGSEQIAEIGDNSSSREDNVQAPCTTSSTSN